MIADVAAWRCWRKRRLGSAKEGSFFLNQVKTKPKPGPSLTKAQKTVVFFLVTSVAAPAISTSSPVVAAASWPINEQQAVPERKPQAYGDKNGLRSLGLLLPLLQRKSTKIPLQFSAKHPGSRTPSSPRSSENSTYLYLDLRDDLVFSSVFLGVPTDSSDVRRTRLRPDFTTMSPSSPSGNSCSQLRRLCNNRTPCLFWRTRNPKKK